MYAQHEMLSDTIEQNVLDNVGDSILKNYGQDIVDEIKEYFIENQTDSITYKKYSLIVRSIISIQDINALIENEIWYEFVNGMFDSYNYLLDIGYSDDQLAKKDNLKLAVSSVKSEQKRWYDYQGGYGGAKYIIAMLQSSIFDML